MLNSSFNKWLKRQGFKDFSTVLKLVSERFEAKEKDLLGHIEKELKAHRDHLVEEGRLGRRFGLGGVQLLPPNKADKEPAKLIERYESETEEQVVEDLADVMKRAKIFMSQWKVEDDEDIHTLMEMSCVKKS